MNEEIPSQLAIILPGEAVHTDWAWSSEESGGLQLNPERVAAVLDFLSELAHEAVMKDWMGDSEGNVFWPALLALLCNTPPPQTTQTHASLLGAAPSQKVGARFQRTGVSCSVCLSACLLSLFLSLSLSMNPLTSL